MNPKLLITILASLSIMLMARVAFYVVTLEHYPDNHNVAFDARVSNEPRLTTRGQRITVSLPNAQRVTANLSSKKFIRYGDRLRLEGRLKYVELEDGDKILLLEDPEFKVIDPSFSHNLLQMVRERIITVFNSSLGPREAALMLGIVFGIKQEMPESFEGDLRDTGLMHVIAASGMNIAMVGGFLLAIFSYFMRRKVALISSMLGIICYAVLAGLEPSIVRASIMGLLVFGAQMVGRQNTSYLGLFFAGFMMLFVSPSLILDVGFQLSFLATFGLIFFRPILSQNRKLGSLISKSVVGEDIATTVTAQLWTLPVLLLNFGTYSIFSVIVNALVLWSIPILMIIGGISALFGLIYSPLGGVMSYVALPLLIYFQKIVGVFGGLGTQFSITQVPVLLVCGYYCLIFAFSFRLKLKKGK